jgi:hypothetical protein
MPKGHGSPKEWGLGTKQNKTKQNKTKQNKPKQGRGRQPATSPFLRAFSIPTLTPFGLAK